MRGDANPCFFRSSTSRGRYRSATFRSRYRSWLRRSASARPVARLGACAAHLAGARWTARTADAGTRAHRRRPRGALAVLGAPPADRAAWGLPSTAAAAVRLGVYNADADFFLI